MTSKELAAIFEEIEIKLISSYKRNLEKHRQWEKDLDFEWTAWQALKIKALERFRKENKDILSEYTEVISAETRKMLEEQFAEGEDLEAQQLEEYGFTETTNDNFFEIFDEKIESIIEEVQGKETTVEKAALRMMDDVYRQTLIKAETAVATGSQTIQQAIEDAVREFAKKGINCIEYRDGRRVNIADYVYMALRTANTRANLLGQAKQRTALGVDTVRVSSYNACSETCLPWQGGVYIDDVFALFDGEISGDKGKSKNGKWYTLLSVAVRAGLFHPNCRHSLTTYSENARESPKVDGEEAKRRYKLEQQQRALERKVRYWKRRLEAESDPIFKETLKKSVRNAQKNLREFVNENKDVLRRDPWREKTYNTKDETKTLKTNKEQHQRYRKVLGDKIPEALAEFEGIKYNDSIQWGRLKKEYRTVNQYKIDSGSFTTDEILELDRKLISEKRENFNSKHNKSGNIAGAYLNGDKENFYLAHSKIDSAESNGAKSYKGTSNLVYLSDERQFSYIEVESKSGKVRNNTYVDTEAKLFEYFEKLYQLHPFESVTMISERGMCDSCKGVMEQFKKKHPNIILNIISNKKVISDVWKYR